MTSSRIRFLATAAIALFALVTPAYPWSEHAIFTRHALLAMPEVEGAAAVPAETLESFLNKEAAGIESILAEEESYARANLMDYPARPDSLAFKADGKDDVRTRFLRALRVNPESKIPLALQLLPGDDASGKTLLPVRQMSVYKNPIWLARNRYALIQPGQNVKPIDIVTTASDEPDLGLDIGLFEDNGTEWGKAYGFGVQPFGNPSLEYSSQAPFHMGFFHEAKIIYVLASFLKHTYPEIRARQYYALSQYAFRTGHPYWGYRFMGWGLHYIGDLTQPYHARVLPGVGVLRMLWINLLDILGKHQAKLDAIQLVSNRHSAIESFYQAVLRKDLEARTFTRPYWAAVKNASGDSAYPPYGRSTIRDVLTRESESRADVLDETISATVPARLVSDPSVEFAEANAGKDITVTMEQARAGSVDELSAELSQFAQSFGSHTRNYAKAVLSGKDVYR